MAPKSIFRQPGAKHFQLVHRSQRDPLIHDSEAAIHVLKPVVRENDKKGKSRAELEALLSIGDTLHESHTTPGDAALYGIYYDDAEYDYMQHLRQVGVQEDGVDSILIEAPSSSKRSGKEKKSGNGAGLSLRDLPEGVLPSTSELPRNFESQQAIPDSISGFQPDMDPHLRQVLEALEDDAFVDDNLEDDFFGELITDGERPSDEEVDYPFFEDGVVEGSQERDSSSLGSGNEDEGWEARFDRFKKSQQDLSASNSDDGEDESDGGDTVAGLPTITVIGGKKRWRGGSDASGYSMSSSSMYRNEALQILDERFDQVMLKEYNEDEDEDDRASMPDDSESDEAPELITARDDFSSMMDEFLNDYEILGRKMKPKLEGDSGVEKLETLRRAMGQDQRVKESYSDDDDTPEEDLFLELEEDKKDRWDCETILTTYTNLENHPRLIRACDTRRTPKITLDPKTGLPSVVEPKQAKLRAQPPEPDLKRIPRQATVTRPRNESAESKKARKTAVKVNRAMRRAEKKATKKEFGSEFKVQVERVTTAGEKTMRKL
ncbi:LTV-domain-containing protein [Guyanagaster necrorhizus]|uniref:LTV-domain-containing protein n=1 Tax=Guyanagaster necrorhizus TaxID=856835 RepID=A0A9P7W3X4_9AGAR|nr:LTV-domain-containing protein [Guyanagaster necrorhizus MCA 3950]KAG7452177.1 LTV-domain-containing protein [Guyanagaster necrorhizus MCA 3950]